MTTGVKSVMVKSRTHNEFSLGAAPYPHSGPHWGFPQLERLLMVKSRASPLPHTLDTKLWPSILLTILWRLWDARNREVFYGKRSSILYIISQVIDHLTTWEKCFISRKVGTKNGIRVWRMYLQSCKHTPVVIVIPSWSPI